MAEPQKPGLPNTIPILPGFTKLTPIYVLPSAEPKDWLVPHEPSRHLPNCPEDENAERTLCVQTFIARSNHLALSRCCCGHYWLTLPDDHHIAEGCEQALAEIIESLARLELPGALTDGRRA